MNNTIKHGLIAGALMSLLLFSLSISGSYGGSPLKFAKYLILLGAIAYSLKMMRSKLNDGDFFPKAIMRGLNISLIAAAILSIVNVTLFLINPEFAISKWNLSPDTFMDALVISGSLVFEIFVFGGIATFIVFQGMKPAPYIES